MLALPAWLPRRALIIGGSNYFSVLLALYVAFSLNLQNPWWAMLTVYFVQPPQRLTGAIWAKAFYRAAGTIVAGAVGIAIIPNLADSPALLLLAVSGWLGLCTFVGVLDRSPRAYFFLLAGYTVVLTALPAAFEPAGIFDVMVSRIEEILIGVLAVALVQSVFFPLSVADAANARLRAVMGDMRHWIVGSALSGQVGATANGLAVELSAIHSLASDWRFEGTLTAPKRRALSALEERLVALLPTIAAVGDGMADLHTLPGPENDMSALAQRVGAWVESDAATQAAARPAIEADIEGATPALAPDSSAEALLRASVVTQLLLLVRRWSDCRLLAGFIAGPDDAVPDPALRQIEDVPSRELHTDLRQAALSGFVAMLTLVLLGVFSIATRWEAGVYAMGIAAIPCSLFAFADDPRPMTRDLVFGLLAIFPVLFLYQFAVLPKLDGFPLLGLSLLPVLLPLGVAANLPKYTLRALGMLAGFSAGLALQPRFNSDLATLLNLYFAVALGAITALAVIGLIRVIPAERSIARILQAGWLEMADHARNLGGAAEGRHLRSRMVDRAGLLVPRLQQVQGPPPARSGDMLRNAALADALVELAKLRTDPRSALRPEIDATLQDLAAHFSQLAEEGSATAPEQLVDRLDIAAATMLGLETQAERRAGITALATVRRALLPDLPSRSWRPSDHVRVQP